MSSTILYKFRSGTTFEALPLPGSAARLFDVKKAIVQAKKLDAGTMEFDLSVRNAATNEEYNDESMLLPRGTRLIVQRLPAAKGQGFLARMARNQYGMTGTQASGPTPAAGGAPSGFYNIDSRVNDDDEEFISSAATGGANDEDKELAALKAVTDTASSSVQVRGANTSQFARSGGPAGQGPPQHHQQGGGPPGQQRVQKQRANADPELRKFEDQEKQKMGRKRATGIPRTFLNVKLSTENNEGDGEGESNTPLLQPNTLGFEELKNRGGGQSENAAGTKKSLDYALKVTATTIPDYLQCALCHSVALTAMFLTWDPEGRTTCDKCIRDALTKNGFRDPLTGMEGISPDDLRPNPGIRKAAEAFVKEVMDKIEEIEKQQVEDEPTDNGTDASKSGLLEGDSGGVVVTKRNSITKRKAKEEEDPFGGDDDFGGDVFAVAADEKPEDEDEFGGDAETAKEDAKKKEPEVATTPEKAEEPTNGDVSTDAAKNSPKAKENSQQVDNKNEQKDDSSAPSRSDSNRHDRRVESRQRRGPPAGYQMGPAGGAAAAVQAVTTRDRSGSDDYSTNSANGGRGGRGRGGYSPAGRGGGRFHDRGGGFRAGRGRGRGRYGGRYQGRGDWDNDSAGGRDIDYASRSLPRDDFSNGGDSHEGRSSKRPRQDSQDYDDRRGGGGGGTDYGSYNQGGHHGGGYNVGGGYNSHGGGWNDRGGGRGWDGGHNQGGGGWDRGGGRGWDRGGRGGRGWDRGGRGWDRGGDRGWDRGGRRGGFRGGRSRGRGRY